MLYTLFFTLPPIDARGNAKSSNTVTNSNTCRIMSCIGSNSSNRNIMYINECRRPYSVFRLNTVTKGIINRNLLYAGQKRNFSSRSVETVVVKGINVTPENSNSTKTTSKELI